MPAVCQICFSNTRTLPLFSGDFGRWGRPLKTRVREEYSTAEEPRFSTEARSGSQKQLIRLKPLKACPEGI